MTNMTLTFDAVDEAVPGPKWAVRWHRSWPAYETWFVAQGGDLGPSRTDCRAAMQDHMPELVPVYDRLVLLAGGSDRAARFLSTWCPPCYLGGCSIAAVADGTDVRLVRNYDLSPDLNEGLLLRSEWTGRPVMGMVEFLWGLSDGINDAGLSIALAYGGRSETGTGFGITTILRYVLEVCDTVEQARQVLLRVPSHMAYNVVVADASGQIASLELLPGGGAHESPYPFATNHQSGRSAADRPNFTRTHQRHDHLSDLEVAPDDLVDVFLQRPLRQDRYADGFGTLFTAGYDPVAKRLCLAWPGKRWEQALHDFAEGCLTIDYDQQLDAIIGEPHQIAAARQYFDLASAARIDWAAIGETYARRYSLSEANPDPSRVAGTNAPPVPAGKAIRHPGFPSEYP